MSTITLNVKSDLDVNMLIARISMLKGVENVSISNNEIWKEDIEAWKDWSDEDETNYLKSIPGVWKSIEEANKEPIGSGVPINNTNCL